MQLREILYQIDQSKTIDDCYSFLNLSLYQSLNKDHKRYIYSELIETYNKKILLNNLLKNDFIFMLNYYYDHPAIFFSFSDNEVLKNTIISFKYYQNKIDDTLFMDDMSNFVVYKILQSISPEILENIKSYDSNNDSFEIKKSIIINYLKNEDYTLDDLECIVDFFNTKPSFIYEILFFHLDKETCIDYLIYKFGFTAEKEFIEYLQHFFNLHIEQYFNEYDNEIVEQFIEHVSDVISEFYLYHDFNIVPYLNGLIDIFNYNNFEDQSECFMKHSSSKDELTKIIKEHKELRKNIELF